MQITASASQWVDHTERSEQSSVAMGPGALYVRMRVACTHAPAPATTVIVDTSIDGEGWTPLALYTFAGFPAFLGFGASAARDVGSPVQGGVFAVDYIRVFEDLPNAELTSAGGSQQIG
jgi:hypothetical protein